VKARLAAPNQNPKTALSWSELSIWVYRTLTFYFNVHSAANSGGEIRGQIDREVFVAHTTGSQETKAVESGAIGGRLVLTPTIGAVSGKIELLNSGATAAHCALISV
jgi:hypothetical protein